MRPLKLADAATAAVHSASAGIATGVLGCMIAGNLGFGAVSAAVGLLAAGALCGQRLWRATHPRRAFLDARDRRGRPLAEAHVDIR